jgi:K+-transporting ATPase A subunit
VIFGGVGAGLYGMLLFVLIAVFLAGLMIGRTPEYLGKKLEAREVRLLVATLLVIPLGVLVLGRWGGTGRRDGQQRSAAGGFCLSPGQPGGS